MHHHYHILQPILALVGAQFYMELGTFAGSSLRVAVQQPTLHRAISVDTYAFHTTAQVRANVGPTNVIIDQRVGRTDDRNILRSLYQGAGGGQPTPQPPFVDVLFIDAGHAYHEVQDDFRNYFALVRPGGVIVFDDYHDPTSPGVKPAVDDIVQRHPTLNVLGALPNLAKAFANGFPLLETISNEFIVQKPLLPLLQAVHPFLERVTVDDAPEEKDGEEKDGEEKTDERTVGRTIERTVDSPHFGIVMATYQRPSTTKLARTLQVLKAQTYPHWTLFLTGDCYTDDGELCRVLADSGIPPEKIILTNLPIACEREFATTRLECWCTGGATAMNYSLQLIHQAGLRYTAHLDDDDGWTPDHLAVHAAAYRVSPSPVFVASRGKYVGGRILPARLTDVLPSPSNLLHSAASWDITALPFFYRTRIVAAADAGMWERIAAYCVEKGLRTVLCPEVTVDHTEEGSV